MVAGVTDLQEIEVGVGRPRPSESPPSGVGVLAELRSIPAPFSLCLTRHLEFPGVFCESVGHKKIDNDGRAQVSCCRSAIEFGLGLQWLAAHVAVAELLQCCFQLE